MPCEPGSRVSRGHARCSLVPGSILLGTFRSRRAQRTSVGAHAPPPADVYDGSGGSAGRLADHGESMASSSGSAYSAAREPDDGEWDALRTLDDILAWARVAGTMDYIPSQRGSLLVAAGGDIDTSIEEFAAIPVDNFLHILDTLWVYSASTEPGDSRSQDMTTSPSEIIKARAVSAHHVARIWVGAETSRAWKPRRLSYTDTKDQEYRDAKLHSPQAPRRY